MKITLLFPSVLVPLTLLLFYYLSPDLLFIGFYLLILKADFYLLLVYVLIMVVNGLGCFF